MIERVDDDGWLRFQPDRAEQTAFEIRANRKYRVEQQQQPSAARQVFVQQICFAGRECRARTDSATTAQSAGMALAAAGTMPRIS